MDPTKFLPFLWPPQTLVKKHYSHFCPWKDRVPLFDIESMLRAQKYMVYNSFFNIIVILFFSLFVTLQEAVRQVWTAESWSASKIGNQSSRFKIGIESVFFIFTKANVEITVNSIEKKQKITKKSKVWTIFCPSNLVSTH